ncbi:MAG: hypothetical protein GX851_04825 [Clostridiales bacterium]|nr:hypothetical protein [Clostridiales bacterium]
MKKNRPEKYIFTAVCIVLTLLLGMCGCGADEAVDALKTAENTVPAVFTDAQYHVSAESGLTEEASAGYIRLLADRSLGAVAVSDTLTGKLWSALPTVGGSFSGRACAVSAVLSDGKKYYELNSQDNAAAFGTISAESIPFGVAISYVMAQSAEAAVKSYDTLSAGEVRLEITINYTLEDEVLHAVCDTAKTRIPEGFYLYSVSLLEYFGACSDSGVSEGDFMLLPDGCGALMYTSECTTGRSESFTAYSDALVPAFGAKQGTSAFAALVAEGAAASRINAQKDVASRCRRVWAEFVFDSQTDTPQLGVYFRFLNGANADYPSMAAACREHLVRQGMTDSVSDGAQGSVPFFITLTGKVKKTDSVLSVYKSFTKFDEAEDMLTVIKAKGITNLKVRYTGALSGGVSQKDISSARPLISLGGKSGLKSLAEFAENQNIGLFLDVGMVSSSVHGGFSSDETYGAEISALNPLAAVYGPSEYRFNTLKTPFYRQKLLSLLELTSKLSIGGYCINEAGTAPCADAAEALAQLNTSLGAEHEIMVDGGAFCFLKNASYISEIPLSAHSTQAADYVTVPFVQMVLHGSLMYSGEPLNLAEDADTAYLRMIEYGACPSVMWNYRSSSPDDVYYYSSSLDETVALYEKTDAALAGLQSMRITDHYEAAQGVYVTEYNNSVNIYVNYNDTDVAVGGVNVGANDFLRID